MCGRYTNTANPSFMAGHFGLVDVPDPVERRFNIAPTDEVLIAVRAASSEGTAGGTGYAARRVRWGLIPHWSKDRKSAARMINARSEQVFERPAYRELVADPRARCLVLADGYYEWLKAEDPRQPRVPMRFVLAQSGAGERGAAGPGAPAPFAFAGLRTSWRSPEGDVVRTATILTTAANAVAAPIHDRMPVILPDPDSWARWLDPALDRDGVAALARPLDPERLAVLPASPLVNSVRNDGPDLLEVPAESRP